MNRLLGGALVLALAWPALAAQAPSKKPSKDQPPSAARQYQALIKQYDDALRAWQKDYQAAKAPLEKLVELYPSETGAESSSAMLAEVYHHLGETNAEQGILGRIAAEDDEPALDSLLLSERPGDASVPQSADRYLAAYLAEGSVAILEHRRLVRAEQQSEAVGFGHRGRITVG